jgi:Protein of unknown function (DUF1064)
MSKNALNMSKYHNRKTTYQDIQFDSRKEAARYVELQLLERAGDICDIELQPRYDIAVNGMHICFYRADFRYKEVATGLLVVEDVKGFRTKDYIIKKKLMKALYGIEVKEV